MANPVNKKQTEPTPPAGIRRKTSLWVNLLVALLSPLVFLAVTEGVLALAGVKPLSLTEDPYFGFSGAQPLFLKQPGPDGQDIYRTNPVKLQHFNPQSFSAKKAPGTFRIFALGGSTTYGHPWRDTTSFSAWLREYLAEADTTRRYEVINVGGISYASYRTAKLTEELLEYEPDLFIVYNGHNEFLEERTYRGARQGPAWVRDLSSTLDRTRTYSVMRRAIAALRGEGGDGKPGEASGSGQLAGEVDDVLARTVGPTSYTRDDALRKDVLEHYYVSQKRVALLAGTAGARVIYLTTPSNEKDCSPFKSEPTPGLTPEARARVAGWLAAARSGAASNPEVARALYDSAVRLDPRNAEVLYAAGQAALRSKDYPAAKALLVRALNEDVCPLRALPSMRETERKVAEETGSGFVDFTGTLEAATRRDQGHDILGEPDFVDHVHLTIADYGLIARGILDEMTRLNMLRPGAGLDAGAEARVQARIYARLTDQEEGLGYHNVAKVLNWAGKREDAARIALRGLAKDTTSLESIWSSLFVGADLERQGRSEAALTHYYRALQLDPNGAETLRLLGEALQRMGRHAEAEKYLIQAGLRNPAAQPATPAAAASEGNSPQDRERLARIAYSEGRFPEALIHLKALTTQDPGNVKLRMLIAAAHMAMGNTAAAKQELRSLIARDPKAGDPWEGLGFIAESEGDFAGALKNYRRAVQLNPNLAEAQAGIQRLSGAK